MKQKDVLAAFADLAGDNSAKCQAAVAVLESLPIGFLEDHRLPRKKVAPYIPRLAELLETDVPLIIKKWCAQLLGESGIQSPELLKSLVRTLETNDDGVLVAAIWAIGEYRAKGIAAVDALIRHTAHPSRDVRWRAVWALEAIRPRGQHYAEVFAKLFDDSDSLVRGYAVLGFVSAATPSSWAVAQLQRAATDEDDMPRIHAQSALQEWASTG